MTRLEALSNPTKLRLVRHLERAGQASLGELATAGEVHVNTARQHLAELETDGAVVRLNARGEGRGRPELRYSMAPDWTLPSADFRGLAEVLAAVLARAGASEDELRAVGQEWGRYLLGRPGRHDIERELPLALERLGFSAHVDGNRLELLSCPCSLVLPERPQMICGLAVAVADGVLAGAGSPLRIGRRHHDPEHRACSVELTQVVHA